MGAATCAGALGPRAGSSAMGSRLHKGEMDRCVERGRASAGREEQETGTGEREMERERERERDRGRQGERVMGRERKIESKMREMGRKSQVKDGYPAAPCTTGLRPPPQDPQQTGLSICTQLTWRVQGPPLPAVTGAGAWKGKVPRPCDHTQDLWAQDSMGHTGPGHYLALAGLSP